MHGLEQQIASYITFIQGAARSQGGKSILALNSTWKDKEGNLKSSIIPFMPPGTIVTTPRTEVEYVIIDLNLRIYIYRLLKFIIDLTIYIDYIISS
jgi:hypothetical protein